MGPVHPVCRAVGATCLGDLLLATLCMAGFQAQGLALQLAR